MLSLFFVLHLLGLLWISQIYWNEITRSLKITYLRMVIILMANYQIMYRDVGKNLVETFFQIKLVLKKDTYNNLVLIDENIFCNSNFRWTFLLLSSTKTCQTSKFIRTRVVKIVHLFRSIISFLFIISCRTCYYLI